MKTTSESGLMLYIKKKKLLNQKVLVWEEFVYVAQLLPTVFGLENVAKFPIGLKWFCNPFDINNEWRSCSIVLFRKVVKTTVLDNDFLKNNNFIWKHSEVWEETLT